MSCGETRRIPGRSRGARRLARAPRGLLSILLAAGCAAGPARAMAQTGHGGLPWIRVSDDGKGFVCGPAGEPFVAWGFNYDHDAGGRLLEDYWRGEWDTVAGDFAEMKALGANAVRIHLQLGRFMKTPDNPDRDALGQLARLVRLAEATGLYLDITGLGCYHAQDVPPWYDSLNESARWDVQARFWEAVAQTCVESPAVFCYDLMNEPVLPGDGKPESAWLAGAFGDKHFVQRISLDLAGRSRAEVAGAWVNRLTGAIRHHDQRHLVTVGVIPWAYHFHPGAREPVFYSAGAETNLDFVSVHFYPERGDTAKALDALSVYERGKPLVIEEIFPLRCGIGELNDFIEASRATADGWIGFYWGRTVKEYRAQTPPDLAGALTAEWLTYFRGKAPAIRRPPTPQNPPVENP